MPYANNVMCLTVNGEYKLNKFERKILWQKYEVCLRKADQPNKQLLECTDTLAPVSYTHLDVYKRQVCVCVKAELIIIILKSDSFYSGKLDYFVHGLKNNKVSIKRY